MRYILDTHALLWHLSNEARHSIIVAAALYCREFYGDEVYILTNDIAITESGLAPTIW